MNTLLGAVLMAIGVLVAGTAGLCGAILAVMASSLGSPAPLEEIATVAAMVALPIAIGAGLFVAGYQIQKSDRPARREREKQE